MSLDRLVYLQEEYKYLMNKSVRSQAVGNVKEFDGVIVDVNDGHTLHFLVRNIEDRTLWLREPHEIGLNLD